MDELAGAQRAEREEMCGRYAGYYGESYVAFSVVGRGRPSEDVKRRATGEGWTVASCPEGRGNELGCLA